MPVTKATAARCQSWVASVIDRTATRPIADQLDARDAQEDQLLRHPVGDHAAEQRGQQHADRAGGRDHGQLAGAAADPDDLPHLADDPHAGGEGGQHQREGEPPVGGVPERRERARQLPTRYGFGGLRRASAARSSLLLAIQSDRCGPTVATEFIAARSRTTLPRARRCSRSACARPASAKGYVVTSGCQSPAATRSSARTARPGMPPGSAIIRGPRLQPTVTARSTTSAEVELGRRASRVAEHHQAAAGPQQLERPADRRRRRRRRRPG